MALKCAFFLYQSAMSKNSVKLLCEDPVFAEYIKCILMDERTFLNNNIVYTFLTHFLLKVSDLLLEVPRIVVWCMFFQLKILFSQFHFLWFKRICYFTGPRAGVFWSKLCQFNQYSNYKSNKSVSKPRIWFQQPESWNLQSKLYFKWGESFLSHSIISIIKRQLTFMEALQHRLSASKEIGMVSWVVWLDELINACKISVHALFQCAQNACLSLQADGGNHKTWKVG